MTWSWRKLEKSTPRVFTNTIIREPPPCNLPGKQSGVRREAASFASCVLEVVILHPLGIVRGVVCSVIFSPVCSYDFSYDTWKSGKVLCDKRLLGEVREGRKVKAGSDKITSKLTTSRVSARGASKINPYSFFVATRFARFPGCHEGQKKTSAC